MEPYPLLEIRDLLFRHFQLLRNVAIGPTAQEQQLEARLRALGIASTRYEHPPIMTAEAAVEHLKCVVFVVIVVVVGAPAAVPPRPGRP